MKEQRERILNVENQLKGMPVITSETGERIGDVTDAVVHPTEGRLLGIAVRTPNREERAVPAPLFTIGLDAVMVRGSIGNNRDTFREEIWSGAMASKGLAGANVVTEDGTSLGRVSDIFVSADEPRVAFRVVESSMQQFFGGGFYLSGDVPTSYASDGTRVIVPKDARTRLGKDTAIEALRRQPATAAS